MNPSLFAVFEQRIQLKVNTGGETLETLKHLGYSLITIEVKLRKIERSFWFREQLI